MTNTMERIDPTATRRSSVVTTLNRWRECSSTRSMANRVITDTRRLVTGAKPGIGRPVTTGVAAPNVPNRMGPGCLFRDNTAKNPTHKKRRREKETEKKNEMKAKGKE